MPGPLTGKRILIVEDEYFIAADLRRALQEQGADVVGPAGTIAGGMSLIGEPLDAAVVDINLEGSPSFAMADELGQRRVPYMFLTGYDSWAMPEGYRDVPRLTKPYSMERVVHALCEITAPS